jgi:hypothetical protein
MSNISVELQNDRRTLGSRRLAARRLFDLTAKVLDQRGEAAIATGAARASRSA